MKTENAVLMRQARESLKGKWGIAVGTFLLYQVLMIAIQSIPKGGGLLYLIIAGPMALGIVIFSLALSRNQNPKIEQIFEGFKRFGQALIVSILMMVFIFLWALLLIIPGIIAALSYSMTYFIMVDDISISASDAIKKSKKMMYGNKWKLFCLHFRFFGWALLCILSLGIGFLWLTPYIQVSIAKFYEDIKGGEVKPAEVQIVA